MRNFIAMTILFLAGVVGVNAQTDRSDVAVSYNFLRSNVDFNVTPTVGFDTNTDSHGVSVGYTRYTKGDGETKGVAGFTTEAAVNFNSSEVTMATFLAGLQLKARNAEVIRPYVRAMAGVGIQKFDPSTLPTVPTFDRTNTSIAYDLGGGVDWKVGKSTELRTGFDYVNTSFGGSRQNNFRGTFGIVF